MSKKAQERALQRYALKEITNESVKLHDEYVCGYEQAEKDTIARIREQVKQWMPEKDGEEYTDGKRLAFNSVLHLLKEIEEEQ